MLIRFVVSNFMSFKEETEFNMLKSKGNGSRSLTNHIHQTNSGIEILKLAAIYGANAAGKSNLVKAIAFLKSIIVSEIDVLIPQNKRFRIEKTYIDKSSTFRIEYEYDGIHFDYGVEIFKGKIIEEWLYLIETVSAKPKEVLLFKRTKNNVVFGDYFNNKEEVNFASKFLKIKLSENKTVLSICYNVFEKKTILKTVREAFKRIVIVQPDTIDMDYISNLISNQKSKNFAKNLLLNSKTGIEDLIIEKINADLYFGIDDNTFKNDLIEQFENNIPEDKLTEDQFLHFLRRGSYNALIKRKNEYLVLVLKTKHFNSELLFDFEEESDGTNRIFELSSMFESLISQSNFVFIIDELERSMHPILAKELLRMFALNSVSKNQLIFTTHESHLLDDEILRRDEIWLTEKKPNGSSEFYPLSNFNPRGDKVLERGYLQGRYGGIPFLGDFSKLIEEV